MNFIKNFIKSKPILFFIIIFFSFFIVVNKLAKNFLQQTKMEKRNIPEYIKQVYGEGNVQDYQKVFLEQTAAFEYKQFVEFIEKERLGEFTSVSTMGNRCNYNNLKKCKTPEGGKKEIWIFGGSTTFGYGVKNNETISAYLENFFDKEYNVINFGSGFYYSTQERILFNNLLTKLPAPFAVVFIDGFNDFGKNYAFDESAFTKNIKYKMSKSSKDDLIDYFKERFYRLNVVRLIKEILQSQKKTIRDTNSNFPKRDALKMVETLINNQKITKAISEKFEIKLINILQPVPIYNDSYESSNLPEDFSRDVGTDSTLKKVKLGYELYLKKKPSLVMNLSDLKISKPMYIDGVHYSPEFNLAIAKIIKQKLNQ